MSAFSFPADSVSDDDPRDLTAYGRDETRERGFASHREAGLVPARVVGVDRGRCHVVTADGPLRADTSALAGPEPASAPCAGDWASLRPAAGPDRPPRLEALVTSAETGEGLDRLAGALTGTVVLLGASGSGKSTLGNILLGENRWATGAVRTGDGKGRHTTVRRELLPLPGGGVHRHPRPARSGAPRCGGGPASGLRRDRGARGLLRFTDCGHDSEPDCAVQEAIAAGVLPRRRLEGYRRLLRENAWAASRSDARLRAERKRREKEITRHLRDVHRLHGRKR